MEERGHLDLESRKGKAPGGYNYPLPNTGIPFIFMNNSGKLRDMVTMLHEGGHAVHSFLSNDIHVKSFRSTPSEVAELASMGMELLTMPYWDKFFELPEELMKAKRKHLEGTIEILPWIATVDHFQDWVYTHPDHNIDEREEEWINIYNHYNPGVVDWEGYESQRAILWQKQLHIYEVPFYYIEYGIAQLGALALYKNAKVDAAHALQQYVDALRLGYTVSIPEIYRTAGIQFNFSKEYVAGIASFVQDELEQLDQTAVEPA